MRSLWPLFVGLVSISAKEVKVSYDGQLSAGPSTQRRSLIRKDELTDPDALKDGSEDEESIETSPQPHEDEPLVDKVEDTIAEAQRLDFDKNDGKRHVHYTAASSPTGVGSSPVRSVWNFGGPVSDPVEADIVKSQKRAETAGPQIVAAAAPTSQALAYPEGCFVPRHASEIEKEERCPDACPMFAEDTASAQHCNFKCVNVSDCGLDHTHTNLAQTVPDKAKGFCRRCAVPGCQQCDLTSHADVCSKCLHGFKLEHGACVHDLPYVGSFLRGSFYFILALPLVYFVVWYVSLVMRKSVNGEEERQGLNFRTQTKLCKPDDGADAERQLWPLKTNTLGEPVAGPGSVLFFRYQLFIMVWALALALIWVGFVSTTDGRLYTLGTEDPQSPRELCSVIHQGFEAQRTLMSTKASFLLCAYLTSFKLCISFAILQRRAFHRLNMHSTHADFVALVDGLPPINGSEELEEVLKTELQKATAQDIVGVSVGWDIAQKAEKIHEILEADVIALDTLPVTSAGPVASRSSWFRMMDNIILTKVLGIDLSAPASEEEKVKKAKELAVAAENIAKSLVCSPRALLVFRSEAARDAALESQKEVSFRGSTLRIKPLVAEPMGISWENIAFERKERRPRMWAAIKMILLASFLWSVCIYLPFAQYASSSHSNGNKPSIGMTLSFTLIVVIGNQLMYFTCAEAASRVGFLLRDSESGVYMVLYTFAIVLNIFMDAALTGAIAYGTAVAERARTYGGTLISDLTRAQAIFESFEIQRQLGIAVFEYCWPAMFLVPFVGEAMGAYWFALHLARIVVSRFEIKGFKAQQALKVLVPMDAGRYADVLINITAAILIFFLPGGYTLPLLTTLVLSHLFIIIWDHYRVLRCVPSFCFCSNVVDDYGQMLLILPCSFIAAALVLKSNCTITASFCVQDTSLGLSMLGAILLHAGLHWWALQTIVPKLGDAEEHTPTKMNYEQVASMAAPSWFNLNPGHCLRSKYFYKHPTPCSYFIQGREQLLRKNDKAMSFFEDQRKVQARKYAALALA